MSTIAYPATRWFASEWQKSFSSARLSGIVGDATHAANGCYHIGRAFQSSSHYCCTPPNDNKGPSDAATAIDMNLSTSQMKVCTARLINAIDRKDPRARWIAEVYGTVNGSTVTGRLFGEYGSSDSSHLWHVHCAFYRQYATSLQAYKDVLSIIRGEKVGSTPAVAPKKPNTGGISMGRKPDLDGLTPGWKIPTDGNYHGLKWDNGSYGSWAPKGKAQLLTYQVRLGMHGVNPGDVVQGRLVFRDNKNKVVAVQELPPAVVDDKSTKHGDFVYASPAETHNLSPGGGVMVDIVVYSDSNRVVTFNHETRRSALYF